MQSGRRIIPFNPQNFRRFVVGSMLQTLKFPCAPPPLPPPALPPASAVENEGNDTKSTSLPPGSSSPEELLTSLQLKLSHKWKVEHQPFDGGNTKMFYQKLAEFAIGAKPLPTEVLDILRETFSSDEISSLLIASSESGNKKNETGNDGVVDKSEESARRTPDPTTAKGMRRILSLCDFAKDGDNLHRLVASHRIELPEAVHKFVDDHVDPQDPFDELRVTHAHNIFAIDSISTSEVDDAIGIRTDEDGNEVVTVYVADATVFCPVYSELEQFSARTLTTTTYLPEGVFFMLPNRITQAATLSPDRPSRTFNINFRVNPDTGELFNFSVEVGWSTALRRVTYDQVQDLLEQRASSPVASSPSWLSKDDVSVLQRIHDIAVLRYKAREKRSKGFTGSMPDPLIVVDGTDVVDVRDQIICTKDARLAVAELMIAANEVCSRIAQANKISLPFRGSRPLSSFHEAAAGGELVPPLGYSPLPSTVDAGTGAGGAGGGAAVSFFARTLVADMEKLRGVTRAYYSHNPVYHNGLDTHDYCHSTSPLRRYPDMLVHHQLKTLLARQHGRNFQDMVPEFEMIKLCAHCSSVQAQGKIMQINSDRFWILRFLQKKMKTATTNMAASSIRIIRDNDSSSSSAAAAAASSSSFELRCFVGATEYIRSCPEADFGRRARFSFRSDVYIPEVQLVHSVYHDRTDMLVGVTAMCFITDIDPYLGKLELVVKSVSYEPDVQQTLAKMVTLIADS